ncbi:MAG: hypothetical protein KKE37_13705 [Verrucomicrobia bacterium]|nr:hypothetical protein [Verrucomicrobiota bacterium]MBU4290797.1 hypothetical protein [Verrucomicrobiota bacterium]MBU4430395.1 hypothetical protein [Verrucomicrobiota bacterium]MCG2681250.1 hypothetical protein [Kiritimatiellia bacterium]
MRNNVAIVLLTASTVALLVISIQQNRQIRTLGKQKDSAKPEIRVSASNPMPAVGKAIRKDAAQRESEADNERRQFEKTIHQLESQLETNRSSQPTSAGERPEKSDHDVMRAGIAKMLQKPEMRDKIRLSQKSALELSHAALFEYLQLSPEELEIFKELLSDKQMAVVDGLSDVLDDSISPDERKEKAKRTENATKELEEKMRSFLGDTKYEAYKQYEEFLPEMQRVDRFKQSLGLYDQLGEEQEQKLIVAMHEERNNSPFSAGFSPPESFDPELNSKKQERLIARARDILSESQLNQFENNLKQQRDPFSDLPPTAIKIQIDHPF